MKKLIIIFIIALFSCTSREWGYLIPEKPLVIMDKFTFSSDWGTNYHFTFYQEGKLYNVVVNKELYEKYKLQDTIKGYVLIPQ